MKKVLLICLGCLMVISGCAESGSASERVVLNEKYIHVNSVNSSRYQESYIFLSNSSGKYSRYDQVQIDYIIHYEINFKYTYLNGTAICITAFSEDGLYIYEDHNYSMPSAYFTKIFNISENAIWDYYQSSFYLREGYLKANKYID